MSADASRSSLAQDSLAAFDPQRVALYSNPAANRGLPFAQGAGHAIGAAGMDEAMQIVSGWTGYKPTPLVELKGLAGAIGIGNIFYKDEGPRFGLGSFKALGGAYAVERLISSDAMRDTPASSITVASATDGNHGRSVAWGAKRFGCRCVIYIHAEVSKAREAALADLGAKVVRIDGNYDESVRRCAADSAANGWHVVSDTSYEDYREIPTHVMEGYTVLAQEIVQQIAEPPTHVFVQGGVGGLAAAVCAAFWRAWEEKRPTVVVVEPDLAACLIASARHGGLTTVEVHEETMMAGLSCGEPSAVAWDVLARGADTFMTIPDSFVAPAMRLLARAPCGDPPVVAGESAVAGLAGLIAAMRSDVLSDKLGLDGDSRVIVIGSEGATDPDIYKAIVGI